MAYDAADREFHGLPELLVSAESKSSPPPSATRDHLAFSAELLPRDPDGRQQQQSADSNCYRWLPGGVRVDADDLCSRVYYVSRIECAASAMEMAAIGARNAVLLAQYDLLAASSGSANAAAHTDVLFPKL